MAGEETTNKDQSAINLNSGVAQTGLNMDQSVNQVGQGSLTYALNAAVENFDANSVNYQNEPGNEFCVQFPTGFSLIGHHFIAEQSKHIFFLTNPETGDSHIGYMDNNDCIYKIYVDAKCLNFNIKNPIHKVVHKITNCTTEIYWTDGFNPRRYLSLTDIPYILKPGSPFCDPQFTNEVDCNQLKLQPNFKVPLLSTIDIIEGGNLKTGTYQFAIQYSDAAGNAFTSYYSVTNPTPIADTVLTTPNFDYTVGKSIVVKVTDLDDTGQFEYFNLAVIKTVNDIASVELVGTYFIDELTKEITYTGQNVTQIRLTINDIFEKYPYYEIAKDLTVVQDVLVWDNLTSIDRINYQEIASKIELQWQTYKLPAKEDYADELNATNLRGYLRDEVYAFEIVFLLKNGKQTDGFHIPGRMMNAFEQNVPPVPDTNPDFIGEPETINPSTGIGFSPYWKIYNTATDLGVATGDKIGNATPHRYGNFAYWESDEEYPCNEDVWGGLKGEKIRHHKFPDVLVSPIFESKILLSGPLDVKANVSVFPIGVKVDIDAVQKLILNSALTIEQKADIAGFKIVRGDRSTNKSIIGKGILRNVGSYEREQQTFYFPNYPYNDLTPDPFLNVNNNAYAKESSPWLVSCTGSVDCTIEYIEPNTGRRTTKIVKAGVTDEFCSVGRPKRLNANASAEIGPGNYDVYYLEAAGCYGGDFNWCEPFAIDNSNSRCFSPWLDGKSKVGPRDEDAYATVNVGAGAGAISAPGGCAFLYCPPPCAIGQLWGDSCWCPVQCCRNQQITLQARVTQDPGEILRNGNGERNVGRISSLNCGVNTSVSSSGSSIEATKRMVLNSPETSFGNPFLGNVIKLENVMFGGGRGHFVQVRNNANYKLLSKEAQTDALNSSERIANIGGFTAGSMFAAYQSYLTIYVNGITRKNYAYSYNSIASYDYWRDIPNNLGIKQRPLDIAQYLIPGVLNVGDTYNINNYQRESSVYLKTRDNQDNPKSTTIFWKEYRICNTTVPSTPVKDEESNKFSFVNENYQNDSVTIAPGGTCVNIKSVILPVLSSGSPTYTIQVINTGTSTVTIATPGLPFPNQTNSMVDPTTGLPIVSDKSRITISGVGACPNPGKEQNISVVSYYGSLKNINNSQWGQIYSYVTIDTGYQTNVDYTVIAPKPVVVFGGDTFISRFTFKTKLPFFIDNRVGAPDDSDIFYDEIGNIAYPKYWHSSRSITESRVVKGELLTNIISYKAHEFDCPSDPASINPPSAENIAGTYRTFYDGFFYLFTYGVPNFFCETSYNVDLRQAFNTREGDFWPHVSTGIPDDWVQESFVSIANDNTYYYNRTFSKQNKENFFSHLPPDWEEKLCFTNYPFRAIYSDPQDANADNRVNNWLTYRALSFFDFPQNYGKLTSLDGIQNRAVLARFENKSLLYNTLLTIETSNPQAAYLGNSTLFKSAPPIDFAETDLGYVGSQNKFLLKIPQGQVTVDAKRGQVFLISGNQATDLTAFGSGMNRFFTDHLAFEILRYFPDLEEIINNERIIKPGVDIDNHFNGIGLHGVFDSKYDRIIITKLDYVPLSKDVKYDYSTKDFYVNEKLGDTTIKTIVYLSDKEYFCNKSWTISFNLNTKTWVSFHSYLPNFYMGENNFFYSGLNGCCDDVSGFGGLDIISTSSLAEVVPRETTTTTTTDASGPIIVINCDFTGVAICECGFEISIEVIPTTTTTTTCYPLTNSFELANGFVANSISVDTTVSYESACNVIPILQTGFVNNCQSYATIITVYAESLSVGEQIFDGLCSPLADGWYTSLDVTDSGFVYLVSAGLIVEILPCTCTVTETTTAVPDNITECCSAINTLGDNVVYNSSSSGLTGPINIPGYTASSGTGVTNDKFWAVNTQITEWDITENPFSATFNRNISFPVGFTTSSGIVPINNTTLVAVNDSVTPQKVVELDISGAIATLTNKFDLQTDRVAIGNMIYTGDGKLILINQDSVSSDRYLTQYDYATGTIEVDFNLGTFDAIGIYYCNCIMYLFSTSSEVKMLVDMYPDSLGYALSTISGGGFPNSLDNVTQNMSCIQKGLTIYTTTTTTTMLPAFCYTVSITGDGTLHWTDGIGVVNSYVNTGYNVITVCAMINSFVPEGDIQYEFCSDYVPCVTDCPTTTTTTTV